MSKLMCASDDQVDVPEVIRTGDNEIPSALEHIIGTKLFQLVKNFTYHDMT